MSGGTAHTEGSMSTLSRKSITEYSPYVTLSQSFACDFVNINGGLRMANSNMFHTRWVPQFGFALNLGSDVVVKGALAMGYRNPSFRELYLYRMANPDLQPEKMINYELSVGKRFSYYLSVDITAYYSRGSNLIQVFDNKNSNTGSFINKGIELSAHSHPLDNLHIYATYSYLHTSLSALAGAPQNQYYIGVEWNPVKPLIVAADLKGIGGLYVSEGINYQNYALLNLKLSYAVWRYLTLFVRLENTTAARETV